MPKKEETPLRRARRKYEDINKEQRKQATEQFNTRLPRKDHEEICAFLEKYGIRKIDLIYAGYESMKELYSRQEAELKKKNID